MPRLLRSAVVVLLLSSAAGCGYHRYRHDHGPTRVRSSRVVVAETGPIVASRHRGRTQIVYVQNAQNVYINAGSPEVEAPPAPPPSPRDAVPVDDGRRPFDPQAARAALSHIDVSGCASQGAPTGWGHAKVTFNPDGRVSKVVVDEPRTLSGPAAKCVGDLLGTASVPEYRGSWVEMGTSWRVP